MKSVRSNCAFLLSVSLAAFGFCFAQEPQTTAASQKYKLTIVEGASKTKRVKKGRVSSQAVVKVTDQNDTPVAGIAVAFTIPQFVGSGAAFSNGALTALVTTNAAGVASSGTFVAGAGSAFSMTAAASVPGGVISATVPINTAAALAAGGAAAGGAGAGSGGAGAGAGVSAGVIGGVVAGVAAVAVVAAKVVSGGSDSGTTPAPNVPRGTIGAGAGPTFGAPR